MIMTFIKKPSANLTVIGFSILKRVSQTKKDHKMNKKRTLSKGYLIQIRSKEYFSIIQYTFLSNEIQKMGLVSNWFLNSFVFENKTKKVEICLSDKLRSVLESGFWN